MHLISLDIKLYDSSEKNKQKKTLFVISMSLKIALPTVKVEEKNIQGSIIPSYSLLHSNS